MLHTKSGVIMAMGYSVLVVIFVKRKGSSELTCTVLRTRFPCFFCMRFLQSSTSYMQLEVETAPDSTCTTSP